MAVGLCSLDVEAVRVLGSWVLMVWDSGGFGVAEQFHLDVVDPLVEEVDVPEGVQVHDDLDVRLQRHI